MKRSAETITRVFIAFAFFLGCGLAAFSYTRLPESALSTQVAPITEPTVSSKQADFWIEVSKASLQLALVGVVGAVIAALLRALAAQRATDEKRFEEGRAADRRLIEYRQSVTLRLRSAYRDLKRIRRELRVDGFTGTESELADAVASNPKQYGKRMRQVSDTQLSFEDVETELSTLPNGKSAQGYVHSVTTYLDELVSEWEKNSRTKGHWQFAALKAFTDSAHVPGTPPRFEAGVKEYYSCAVKALQKDILGPPPALAK
jgi:hypothetical protein